MSNKIDIQNSNSQLQTLITKVNSLPQANTWSGNTTITPGTSNTTIPQYNDKELTILGDTDLKASNIKKGVNIFGVTGTLDPSANVINGIIDKYIAQSGTINANSFIEFVSNNAWSSTTQISTEAYSGGSNGCSCACKLSDGRILVLFGGPYIGLLGCIVTISGTTITAGTTQTLVSKSWSGLCIQAAELSANKFIVFHCYREDSYMPSALVVTVSGNTISVGTRINVYSGAGFGGSPNASKASIIVLSSTKVIVFYSYSTYSYLYAAILTISGTTVSVTTNKSLSSKDYVGTSINAVKISDTKIILAHSGPDDKYHVYVEVITISGNTITMGTSLVVNTDKQSYWHAHELVLIDNNSKVLVGYRDASFKPNIAVLSISGTTLTLNSTLLISNIQGGTSTSYNSKIALVKVSEEMVVALYQNNGTLYGKSMDLTTMKLDEVDTTILSGMYSFGNVYDWLLVSDSTLFIFYANNDTYGYAYANVGAIPKYHMAKLSTSSIGGLTKTAATASTFGECYKL